MNTIRNRKSTCQNIRNPLGAVLALLGLLLLGAGSAAAATVTYTASDALNSSSFSGGLGATNWSDGLPPAPGNDYVVASSRTLRSPPTNGSPAATYTFAGDSLTLGSGANSGTLSLKCSNVITVASLIMTNGQIQNGDPGVTPKITRLAGNINIQTNGTMRPSETNRTLVITAALSGNGNLLFSDRGLVNLSGAHTYNGPLTITGTTLDMDGTVSLTPSALIVGKDTILVQGVTNPAGAGLWFTNVYNSTNIVRAGGSLNVGSGSGGDLRVGYRTSSNTNNNVIAVFDVSGQPQFNANVGNFSVGYSAAASSGTRASAAGFVYLATNNNILATNITIADTIEAISTLTSRVLLGSGSNYLDTPTMTMGARKQPAILTLPAGGTLVLSNSASGRADLTVGGNYTGTSGNPAYLMDLSGGPFVASMGNLVIGGKSGGSTGGATATLTTATNSGNAVDVNDITLGTMAGNASGSTTAASGTLNFNGGSLKVNNSISLGVLDTPGYGTAVGTLNQNGGTVSIFGDITTGAGTSTVNVNGGLLDLRPSGDATPGTISVSTLAVNGTITNAGNITVSTALRGTGSVVNQTGNTTVSGTLDPGTSTTPGTLNLGSLTLSSSATLRMNLTNNTTVGSGVNDLLDITGDVDLGNANLVIAQLTSGLAVGTYRLANYTGELINSLTLPNVGRYTLSLVTEAGTPKHLNLVVGGNPYALRWGGQLGSAWDINTTQNWTNQLNGQDFFFDNDTVLFNDTSANPNVTLDVTVQPGNVVFNNTVNAYTVTGIGDISGPIGLTKQGTGVLTIGTSNTFTGPMTISAGKLVAGNSGALGATNSGTTIASGATLDVNDKSMQGELIHVQGAGYDGLGAIINSDTLNTLGARTALRNVVLDGPTTFGGSGRWDIRGSAATGSGSLIGTNLTLTKVGTNGVYLTDGTAAEIGNVQVNEGSFVIESGSIINPNASIKLSNGTSLSFYRLYNPMGRNVTVGDLATIAATSNTTNTQNEVAGTVTLNGQGLLSASGGAQLNIAGPVVGSGELVNAGSGNTVLLNSGNNWLGGTTISNGTLSVGNGIVNGSLPVTPPFITNYANLMFNVATNTTVTPLQEITGPGTLYKRGDGILSLTVSNSFTGNVNTGTGAPLAGGIIQFLNHAAFGDPSVSKTVSVIRAEVQLSGIAQIPPTVYLQTSSLSNATYPGLGLVALRNVAGNTTISNTVELIGGAGSSEYSSDAGLMTFAGPIFLGNTSSRSAIFSGAGNGVVNGQLSNQATNALTVEKNGPGTWTLTAANIYTGPTLVRAGTLVVSNLVGGSGVTVSGGTLVNNGTITAPVTVSGGALAGNGTINNAVIVTNTGTLAPGSSVGMLTINNNLTLYANTLMEVGRNGGTLVHDQASVSGVCTYGGNLVITNVGSSPLQPGDSFQVFSALARNGSFANIVYPDGYTWTNSLSADGRVGVASVIAPPSNPPGFPPGAVAALPDGNISLTATGALGTAWSLRATNDVAAPAANWPVIQNGTISVSPFTINDLTATNYSKRFYLFSTP